MGRRLNNGDTKWLKRWTAGCVFSLHNTQNLSVFLFYYAITYIWEKSGLTFPRIYVLMNLKYQEKKKKEKKKRSWQKLLQPVSARDQSLANCRTMRSSENQSNGGCSPSKLASSQDDLITELRRGSFISIYASEMFHVVILTQTNAVSQRISASFQPNVRVNRRVNRYVRHRDNNL